MIKYVLQAIPFYLVSIYALPNSIISDIEKMINVFWWGWGEGVRTGVIKWLAWEMVTCPKDVRGMGFQNFKVFNLTMIAKQG